MITNGNTQINHLLREDDLKRQSSCWRIINNLKAKFLVDLFILMNLLFSFIGVMKKKYI